MSFFTYAGRLGLPSSSSPSATNMRFTGGLPSVLTHASTELRNAASGPFVLSAPRLTIALTLPAGSFMSTIFASIGGWSQPGSLNGIVSYMK